MNSLIPKIDIRPDHWEIVRDILHKHVPDYEVWAFGSRAKWTAKNYSDLDLAVITAKPLSLDVSANLSDDFSESDLPWKVDIVDWAATQDHFREIIKRDKVVVQKAKGVVMSFDSIELGKIISHRKGLAFKSNDYKPTGHPVVRVSNFTSDSISNSDLKFVSDEIASQSKTVELRALDIVIATVGSWPSNPASIVGKTVMVPEALNGALLNQNSVRLRVLSDSLVDQEYLFYALKNQEFSDYLVSTAQGSANQASITIKDILKYQVPWPEESERKKIASIIGRIRNKIELNTQTNQTLEQIAQAIFKSWFVDFDPVKAKIETLASGGSVDDAELAAMSVISAKNLDELNSLKVSNPEAFNKLAQTAALFPTAMQDSELGEIPEGWEVKPFKKVIDKYVDNRGKTPPIVESGIPLVEVKHLPENSAFPNLNTEKRVTEETYKTWFRVHVEPKDILISTVGTIGRTSFVKSTNFGIAQNVLGLRFAKAIEPEYMFYTIKSHRFQHDMTARLVTTVQSSIKRKDLDTIDILVPTPSIQITFCEFVEPLIDEQFVNNTQNNDLAIIRDTLLPKLLSGEIDLTNEVVE